MLDWGPSNIPIAAAPRLLAGRIGNLRLLALLIGGYALAAIVQHPATYLSLAWGYLTVALPATCCAVALALAALLLSRRHGGPRQLFAALGGRIGAGFATTAMFAVGLAAFSTYKLMIPSVMPFAWDAPFDALDRLLHGGPPWELTHALLPAPLADLIGVLYAMPWFLYWFGTMALVAFCIGEPLRRRYLWTLALTVVLLGSVAATAFASHGPILFHHFGLEGYEGLIEALRQTEPGRYALHTAEYLYGAYAGRESLFGSGISAMPSMHVAIVTLNLCFYASLNRWLGLGAGVFAVLIALGSVHLGWHYAIDAYASFAAVLLLWWVVGRFQRTAPAAPSRTPAVVGAPV